MSELQQVAELCGRVFADSDASATPVQVERGRIEGEFIESAAALAERLGKLRCRTGWLQYQSAVVRPGDCPPTVALDHPDHGRLLDAELCLEDGRSLTIRHTGDGWLTAAWQPGEGDEWLSERLGFRALGGGRLEYLRLWQLDQQGELQPASAWLINATTAGS